MAATFRPLTLLVPLGSASGRGATASASWPRAAASLVARAAASTVTSAPSTSSDPVIGVYELDSKGNLKKAFKSLEDFKKLKRETKLHIRDMRLFFQRRSSGGGPGGVGVQSKDSLPAILSRPSSNCFLLNLDSIKLLCLPDSCLVLHPEDGVVTACVGEMQTLLWGEEERQAEGTDGRRSRRGQSQATASSAGKDSRMHAFLDALADRTDQKFEMVVMETSLATVVTKYRRQMNLLKPVLDILLQETSANPSAAMLRRMLAFRKSLNTFETQVVSVRGAVSEVLREEHDLMGLCLSVPPESRECKEEIAEDMELLLEAYNADLKEVEVELAAMKELIEDTNDFIKMHLNSIRNRIIKLSLFMEMGTMSVGAGALMAGMLGMNLTNHYESHPMAFCATAGGILAVVGSLFGGFALRFFALNKDYSSARSYKAMKEFFVYVENVEMALQRSEGKGLNRREFRQLLEPLTDAQLSEEEVDAVFRVLDENRDGTLDIGELSQRALRRRRRRGMAMDSTTPPTTGPQT